MWNRIGSLNSGATHQSPLASRVPTIQVVTPPFVPVVLVQEDWAGVGYVINRTPEPISGSGTWQQNGNNAVKAYIDGSYDVRALGAQGPVVFRHSVTLTNANMTAVVTPIYSSAGNAPVIIWARSTPGPNNNLDTGYYVECNDPLSGLTPITLRKRVAGGDTELGTSSVDPQFQIVSFTLAGSTITVKVNGTTVIQVTDTQVSTAGYWGYEVSNFGNEDADSISRVGPILIQTA